MFFVKFTAYFGAGSVAVGALVNAAEAVATPFSAAGTQPRPPRGCGTAGATRLSTEPWQGGAPRPGPGRGGAAADGHGPGRRRHDRDRGDRRRDDSPALGRGLGGCRRHDPNGAWDQGRRGFCLLPLFRSQGGGVGSSGGLVRASRLIRRVRFLAPRSQRWLVTPSMSRQLLGRAVLAAVRISHAEPFTPYWEGKS